jgi:lysophospholipase L1-like esterase
VRLVDVLLVPVLLVEGLHVRRVTPRLPEAARREGLVPGAEPALRIGVFGDSVAAGIGVADNADGLAGSIAEELSGTSGRAVGWQVAARGGVSSKTALPLVADLDGVDLVFVSMGINDLLEFRGLRAWRRDLTTLVRALPGRVVLAGMPPLHRFPSLPQPLRWVFAARARLMDAVMAQVATATGAVHAPVHADDVTPEFFAADRFHPSAHGCRALARELVSALRLAAEPPRRR